MSDTHMSRLAGWMLQTVGMALAVSLLVAILFGVIAAISGQFWVAAVGVILGSLGFAVILYNASAPLPDRVDDDARV